MILLPTFCAIAGTDAESGVAAFACTSSNIAPAGGWQSTAQFTLSQNGSYYAWVKDQVGRVSLGKQFTLSKVDVSPPTVVSCNFSDGGLKATIKAADVGSGVKGVYVNDRFIAGETAVCELTDSDLTLKIQAEDMVGHKSTVRTENVPDQIPPTIDKIAFAKDAASVQIVVSDRGNSKLKGVYVNEMLYAVDAMGKATVDVDNQSVFEIRVQAQDNAGNKSAIRAEIVPDVLPPVVKSIVFSPDSKKAVVTATDTGSSGLKGISVNGKLIEGSPVEYTLPENQWDLSVFAEDNAGNKSATVREVAPDVIPPVIQSITFSADSKMVKVIASDLGSYGLKGIYVNGKFFEGTSANYTFPEGHWGLSVYAEDNSGNKSAMVDKIAPDTIPPRIDSVTFSPDNLRATINASDDGSAGLAFVEINDVKYPIVNGKYTYKIPMDTQFLNISVIDGAENASELLVKRVPGWSIEIDTIAITSVEFAQDKKSAVIRADTSDPNREIIGIYVNNLLHRVNPATVTIPDGTEQLVCQAIDNQGDKSRVVVRDVPKDEIPKEEVPVPPIRPEKPEKDKKTRITITQPAWTNGSKPVRVRVTASDADDGIDDISVKTDYDPTWEDITEEGYFILTQDAMVTVRATNGAGEETTRGEEIRCFDDTPPTVSLRNGGDGKLTVTFRDDKSGVKSVTINGQVFSGKELSKGYITYTLKEQTDEVRVYAEDYAGNRSDREELTITLPPVPMTAKPSTRPAVVAQPENPVSPSDGSGGGYSTTTTTTTSRRTKNAQFFKKMQQLHNSPREMEEETPNTVLRMKDSPDNRNQRMLAVGVSCGLFLLLAAGVIAALIVARKRRTPANEEIL